MFTKTFDFFREIQSSFSWPQIRMTAFSAEGKVSGRTTIRANYIELERGSWDSGESSTDDYRSIVIDSTEITFYEKGTMVKRINAHKLRISKTINNQKNKANGTKTTG